MTTTDENRRRAAKAFVERWTYRRGSEKGEDQQFWNDLLGEVLGVADVSARIRYQVPVPMGGPPSPSAAKTTKFLDAWIPETRVLIEHKSRGVDLAAPQAGHGGLTPYEQACEYDNARPFDEKARWIVTCNFDRFEIHDRAKPLAPPLVLRLRDLPREVHRLAFLVDPKEKAVDRELEISVRAGRIVGELYDALLARYASPGSGKCLARSGGEAERDLARSHGGTEENSRVEVEKCGERSALLHFYTAKDHNGGADGFLTRSGNLTRSGGEAEGNLTRSHGGTEGNGRVEVEKCRERSAPLHFYTAKDHNGGADALAALNRLCVRLVFCLYAEDAGVFPKDCLRRLVEATPAEFLRTRLAQLFRVLDTPPARRDPYLEPELAAFPYTNGGLFRMGSEDDLAAKNAEDAKRNPAPPRGLDDIPPLTEEIRRLLLGASRFDWREITPTIFGALFESTLNPETRRAGGMVYTSVGNIHKVIGPLFLDGLTAELDAILASASPRERDRRLAAFQDRLAALTFLDPACGSGNFLTETYVCLRRLENRLIAARQRGQGELDLGLTVKVSLAQFRGIEVNDFAVAVAKTALWIAEAQMRRETAEILHREPDYLPLRDYDGIVEGNALRVDWPRADFIMGNPPFVGGKFMDPLQKEDMALTFGRKWKNLGNMDYVSCWYKKAFESMRGTNACAALVSTNSITQGQAVASLLGPLLSDGLVIDFAWRTFRWDNEASEKAHVHCVIVGFHAEGCRGERPAALNTEETEKGRRGEEEPPCLRPSFISALGAAGTLPKVIYDADGTPCAARNINGYLLDAPNVFVENRTQPLCDVPPMDFGNMPNDGGYFLLSPDERKEVLAQEPSLASVIRPFVGAAEFINRKTRYCFWLRDATPSFMRASPILRKRIEGVRSLRLASTAEATRRKADVPHLFFYISHPDTPYLLVPSTSSENRRYIPIGFMDDETIASNSVLIVPNATLFTFGVLTSSVHMAWVRAIGGRMKSDYRYSNKIVYNNFPWPEGASPQNTQKPASRGTEHTEEATDLQCVQCAAGGDFSVFCDKISSTAQEILDARARYSDASFADLYDETFMPPDLRAAHKANDRAVLAAYGLAPDTPESEIVAHLFRLYAEMVK